MVEFLLDVFRCIFKPQLKLFYYKVYNGKNNQAILWNALSKNQFQGNNMKSSLRIVDLFVG